MSTSTSLRKAVAVTGALALGALAACSGSDLRPDPRRNSGSACDGPRAASGNAGAALYGYSVVNAYPHDGGSWTQGLIWVDSVLVEGTGYYLGPATLRRVELETGNVIQIRDTPLLAFGEGVTQVGDRIVQLTYVKKVAFIYDAETFDSLDTFTYTTQGWGLTHDGAHFIMTDGSDTLYYRDFDTFDVVDKVAVKDGDVPVERLNELEYIDGEVWANVFETDDIVMIEPATGEVTGRLRLPFLKPAGSRGVLNGIAYDAETCRLFVTGKGWTKLFEIALVPK